MSKLRTSGNLIVVLIVAMLVSHSTRGDLLAQSAGSQVLPLMTGALTPTGPGSLYLTVPNDGSFAAQDAEGGLYRHHDSSSSIFDGSLLVAHGTQGSDTTVFLNIYTRPTNGQSGFIPQGSQFVDQSAYGTGTGNSCARAISKLCTKDSVVGITVEWYFPQSYGDDEFVVARYKFYRFQPNVPVTNLAIGILADFDVLPASRLGGIQYQATNSPGYDSTRNLIWQQGVDTCCGVPPATATRFRGGMAALHGFKGAVVGNLSDDIVPGGGPSDAFLYNALTTLSGIDLFTDSVTDLYMLGVLDRGRSIAVGETLKYSIVLVSDTVSLSSLKQTTDVGLSSTVYGPCHECFLGACWCDPNCDGIRSNIQDVVSTINVAFRGTASTTDPGSPAARTDVDADGVTNVIDVVKVINVAFRGQPVGANYVDGCLDW